MNKINSLIVYSLLLSKSDSCDYNSQDIKNLLNAEVSFVGRDLYKKVIMAIASGKSYDEILNIIDNYSDIEYENLLEDQKSYIKTKVKNDLNNRKLKER